MAKESPKPKPTPKKDTNSAFQKFEELARKIARAPKPQAHQTKR